MTNWVHQVLEFDGSVADLVNALVAKSDMLRMTNGYVATVLQEEERVLVAIEDGLGPRLCVARAVSDYLRATPVALSWFEPMNAWHGRAVYEAGHVVALDRVDGDERVVWSDETAVMSCYSLAYLDDPRLGEFTQTLTWERPTPALSLEVCEKCLRDCSAWRYTDCSSRAEAAREHADVLAELDLESRSEPTS
jgi:hypothetical protein